MTIKSLAQRLPSGVYLRSETYEEGRAGAWTEWLSEEEQGCLASFGARSRRCEFLAGRAAARSLLSDRLGVAPEEVPLRRADDDAVEVDGRAWHLSIAHSGLRAVAACAGHAVGVDLEQIQERDAAIARFLFAPADRDIVSTLPYGDNSSLILCWALKEAVLKARRSGFRRSPKDLALSVDTERNRAQVDVQGAERWDVVYEELNGYWGTVAIPASTIA